MLAGIWVNLKGILSKTLKALHRYAHMKRSVAIKIVYSVRPDGLLLWVATLKSTKSMARGCEALQRKRIVFAFVDPIASNRDLVTIGNPGQGQQFFY